MESPKWIIGVATFFLTLIASAAKLAFLVSSKLGENEKMQFYVWLIVAAVSFVLVILFAAFEWARLLKRGNAAVQKSKLLIGNGHVLTAIYSGKYYIMVDGRKCHIVNRNVLRDGGMEDKQHLVLPVEYVADIPEGASN